MASQCWHAPCTLRVLIRNTPNWRGKVSGQSTPSIPVIIYTPNLLWSKTFLDKQLAFRYLSMLVLNMTKLCAKKFSKFLLFRCSFEHKTVWGKYLWNQKLVAVIFSFFQVCPQSLQGTIGALYNRLASSGTMLSSVCV